jgi:hypothetical protein
VQLRVDKVRAPFLAKCTIADLHSNLRQHKLPIEATPVMMNLTETRKDNAYIAAQSLIVLMPAVTVAETLGIQVPDLIYDRPHKIDSLLRHFVVWGEGCILGGRRVWNRLLSFLRTQPTIQGSIVSGDLVATFITSVDTNARQHAADLFEKRTVVDVPTSTSTRVNKHYNTGDTAAVSVSSSIKWLRKQAGFASIITRCATTDSAAPKRDYTLSDSSASFTPGIVVRLEFATINYDYSIFVRATSAFFLRLCFGGLRETQIQTSITAQQDFTSGLNGDTTECSLGVTTREKHPNPLLAKPCGWLCARYGFVSGDRWMEPETIALQEVREAHGDFFGRDTDSINGDPFHPSTTRFIDKPLVGHRALVALRSVLVHICGLTEAQSMAFTINSARAFIAECASALRNISVEQANELCRWSECSFKADAVMTPPVRHQANYTARLAKMVEHYAKETTILQAARVLRETMDSVRTIINNLDDPLSLPSLGGWDIINPRLKASAQPPSSAPSRLSLLESPEFKLLSHKCQSTLAHVNSR